MNHIKCCGAEEDIAKEISKYVNGHDVRVVVRSLLSFRNVIDNDEEIEAILEREWAENSMGFMIPKTSYYINLKMTTIAFIGLLLDVEFTHGFSSFILNVFGITADTIRKLSDTAKCILLFIKAGKVCVEEGNYVLLNDVTCINYMRECDCRQYDRCSISITQDLLNSTIQELLEKKVVEQNENCLVYKF